MRPFPAGVWELLMLVVLVQATSDLNDKHICIKPKLREHEGTTEIPMKKSDAENCVDPSSCARRIQRNGLRWINVTTCCPGYKPTPHLKELVCVPTCPDGCPEFAKCLRNGKCICKSGFQMVSRTPLVCVSLTTTSETTDLADGAASTIVLSGETVKSSPSSPSPDLTTSEEGDGFDTSSPPTASDALPPVEWSSSPSSSDDVEVFDSKLTEYFQREMEGISMSSTTFTTGGGLIVTWMIFLVHVVAGRN